MQIPIYARSLRLPDQHPGIFQRPRAHRIGESAPAVVRDLARRSPGCAHGTPGREAAAQDVQPRHRAGGAEQLAHPVGGPRGRGGGPADDGAGEVRHCEREGRRGALGPGRADPEPLPGWLEHHAEHELDVCTARAQGRRECAAELGCDEG